MVLRECQLQPITVVSRRFFFYWDGVQHIFFLLTLFTLYMFHFGQMHGLTAIFIILELMILSVQLYFYLIWPYDKRRFSYLILLILLILYNLCTGLFPDPDILWLSEPLQLMVAYGFGFLMGAYFPYYFYQGFELSALRFHVLYGTTLFLFLPYLVCFVFIYTFTGKLDFAIDYGIIIPGLYSPVLLYALIRAIVLHLRSVGDELDSFTRIEMLAVAFAVSPWVFMALFTYLRVAQWLEVLFANTGFVLIALLFLQQSCRFERMERRRLLEKDAMDEIQRADFNKTCMELGLSSREREVAMMLCQGMTYKAIAGLLYISARTVDTHAHRIFFKLDVKNKIELQRKLGF